MKYVDEYRSGETAKGIAARIREEADPKREYRFMEFCGGHTHVLSRWGLGDILPESIRMIHGPGCPVCVMPIGRIDMAMNLALNEHVILCTYADAMRVPASKGRSLFKCRAEGGDVRMIYSPMDAVKIARENPDRQVVFFAIGFETTTPPTAAAILAAKRLGLKNFSVFCCHVLTPAAMEHILLTAPDRPDAPKLNGLVGPAHVSTVIGWKPYEHFARDWKIPVVVCGFEPLDMLYSILMLVRQVNDGRSEVENEFIRAVTENGSRKAVELMAQVSERCQNPPSGFARNMLNLTPKSAFQCRKSVWQTIRPVNAAPFCAVKKNPRTAGSLVRSARRRIRLAPAWYLPKAPAPRTTATAVTARLKFRKTPDPAARQRRKTFQAEKNNDS